jgi:hypothetical protein
LGDAIKELLVQAVKHLIHRQRGRIRRRVPLQGLNRSLEVANMLKVRVHTELFEGAQVVFGGDRKSVDHHDARWGQIDLSASTCEVVPLVFIAFRPSVAGLPGLLKSKDRVPHLFGGGPPPDAPGDLQIQTGDPSVSSRAPNVSGDLSEHRRKVSGIHHKARVRRCVGDALRQVDFEEGVLSDVAAESTHSAHRQPHRASDSSPHSEQAEQRDHQQHPCAGATRRTRWDAGPPTNRRIGIFERFGIF